MKLIVAIAVGVAILAVAGGGYWLFARHAIRVGAEKSQRSVDTSKELDKARGELAAATNEYERWIALADYGFWSVDAGALEEARRSAEESLELANKFKRDWNYGNAIHKGNLTLGRIELRLGHAGKAKEYLFAAGRTRGSPQLTSFGPNMLLAKELLEAGERDAVLQYLELCGAFWKNDFGAIGVWRELVEEGRVPNFGANLVY